MYPADCTVLEGIPSVRAALAAHNRTIFCVLIAAERDDREARALRQRLRSSGAPLRVVPRRRIDELAAGRSHGGVVALASARRYAELHESRPSSPRPPSTSASQNMPPAMRTDVPVVQLAPTRSLYG